MDKYSELIRAMSEAFITVIRSLEDEIARLRGDKELLELELRELRAKTDTWWEVK